MSSATELYRISIRVEKLRNNEEKLAALLTLIVWTGWGLLVALQHCLDGTVGTSISSREQVIYTIFIILSFIIFNPISLLHRNLYLSTPSSSSRLRSSLAIMAPFSLTLSLLLLSAYVLPSTFANPAPFNVPNIIPVVTAPTTGSDNCDHSAICAQHNNYGNADEPFRNNCIAAYSR